MNYVYQTYSVYASWISLGITLLTIVLMFLMGCCKCSIGHMHGILFLWTLAQIPVVVLTTDLYTYLPNDDA